MKIEEKIMTKKRFSEAVEKLQSKTKSSYIDAAIEVIEANSLEYEKLGKLLTDSLHAKIEAEAKRLNMLKIKHTGNTLPI